MASDSSGYIKLGDLLTVKIYTFFDQDPGQKVYIEARNLPLKDIEQKHNSRWNRWIAAGVPASHLVPSTRAGPKSGSTPGLPETLPEMSISLSAMFFLLSLSSKGHKAPLIHKNIEAQSTLKAFLQRVLSALSQEETDRLFIKVHFPPSFNFELPLDKHRIDVEGLKEAVPRKNQPGFFRGFSQDGWIEAADLLVLWNHPVLKQSLWDFCFSLAVACEESL